ncbi:hypothetical protein DBT_2141 [Dissulfuribacter thermophilus]|uniref:Uncharacterized protein n=1 Tax=Dissulfuribacter thermophilus TaxID=1156395 RepID=A0A1B9F3B4_9BACT|nr:hypothetical protein DBT_2141 [Dissulfuribacter thermophilus]
MRLYNKSPFKETVGVQHKVGDGQKGSATPGGRFGRTGHAERK